MIRRGSVALTDATEGTLRAHLVRNDGQEDICLAVYQPSTGRSRDSALITEFLPPHPGERQVHGNASVMGDYVLRAATTASAAAGGVAMLHSHPGSTGWQRLSQADADAERSYAFLVRRLTGLPLVGMTLASGDGAWSARRWTEATRPAWCESVRVVGPQLRVSWNEALRPPPPIQPTNLRTVSGWGEDVQAALARLHLLVIGVGTVGLDVGLRLAATGIQHIGVMDFDTLELVNLDRLIGATPLDVFLQRSKAEVAQRLLLAAATAAQPEIVATEWSVCEPQGHAIALDYDLIFSCVDRPWARAVMNQLSFADLIPVIDGGLFVDPFAQGGMRNATWRSHVVRPGRPCLACNRQLDLGSVSADRLGLLDDPRYIAGAGAASEPPLENVAALAVSVTASLLAQFVSFVVGPGGRGDPGPLQYVLSTHDLIHLDATSGAHCIVEAETASGDKRISLTAAHPLAERVRADRDTAARRLPIRFGRLVDDAVRSLRTRFDRAARAQWLRD